MKNLHTQLQKLGLSDKEAEVYLALLQLGPSSVLEISRHCDVKRATIYNVLESLTAKGLVSLQLDGLKNHYVAAPPRNFDQLIQSQKTILEHCMPELEKLQKAHENQNVISQYIGEEGLKTAYAKLYDSLTPSSDYLVFGDIQACHDSNPELFSTWTKRRMKINQKGKAIYNDSPKAREYYDMQQNIFLDIKILPNPTEFNAIEVITSTMHFTHKTGTPNMIIIIENPDIIQLHQERFNLFWNLL